MFAADGVVRPHYALLADRIETAERGRARRAPATLERLFLLQGITFTVYGAESATERIIPIDLFPRIIPAAEWATIEAGLTQRLQALNLFLADIYGDQQILMDGVVPRELVLGAPSYRREMQDLYVPHDAYANVCGSDLIRSRTASSSCWRTTCASPPASPTCWPTARCRSGSSRAPSARPACGRSSAIRTCCWRR